MSTDRPTIGRDPHTEYVVAKCARCECISHVDDDATDGDPCPTCGSGATTAVVWSVDAYIVRPYLAPPTIGTVTTTYFPARPALFQTAKIRVTGPDGTDLVDCLGYSSEYAHRKAAEQYLASRNMPADLGTATPVPGGSGYTHTIKKGV